MGESQEYTLKRLDQWLVDRYNRYYTSEVEREVQSILRSSVKNIEHPFPVFPLDLEKLIVVFKKENQISAIQNFFSEAYSELETSVEESIENDYRFEGVPQDLVSNLRHIHDKAWKFVEFVDKVREKIKKVSPNYITNDDINQAFLEIFGEHKEYTESWIAYNNAINRNLQRIFADEKWMNELTKEELLDYIASRYLIDVAKYIMPYINEKLFGDLEQRVK